MAGEQQKKAVETAAANSPTTTGAGSAAKQAFDNAVAMGGGNVIIGKNPDGTNKVESLKDWQDRWFKMSEAERQKYVNAWAKGGLKTDVINGVNTWVEYGKKSMQLSQYGGSFTPKMLWTQDIASSQGSGSGTVAFTAQDAKAIVQSTYQQLLGRDASGDEYGKALGYVMGQSSSTGASGRQQSLIDYVKGTQEYDAKMENKYLDAMYNAISGKVRAAEA